METIFLDTNVFLDAFLRRGKDFSHCENILDMADKQQIKIITTTSVLVNVIYFLQKAELDNVVIIVLLGGLLKHISLAHTSEQNFLSALHSGFIDLEDAVQYYTAIDIQSMSYFITSNTKDFKKALAGLPVVTPSQFMRIYNGK